MINREKLYKYFGPLLIEALVLIIKDEINILREKNGLAPRTNQQIMQALEDKLKTLEKYNWMDPNL